MTMCRIKRVSEALLTPRYVPERVREPDAAEDLPRLGRGPFPPVGSEVVAVPGPRQVPDLADRHHGALVDAVPRAPTINLRLGTEGQDGAAVGPQLSAAGVPHGSASGPGASRLEQRADPHGTGCRPVYGRQSRLNGSERLSNSGHLFR